MTVAEQAQAARVAARQLAGLTRAHKDLALTTLATNLRLATEQILADNQADIAAAREAGMSEALIDRLTLTEARIDAMADGLAQIAGLADPVGDVVRGWTNSAGLRISQVRVPLGVVGIIYEARPNVTADAAGICLKSGNACLLRGSSSAVNSNRAIVAALRQGMIQAGLDEDAIILVEGGHETTHEMMAAEGLIDVLIPRGGAGLINTVVRESKVPVIETGTGNNHLFVDAAADLDMAIGIILNAKVSRPSVCNALETILVHREIAAEFLPRLVDALDAAGVTVHAGEDVAYCAPDVVAPLAEDEFDAEYLSLDVAVRVVADMDEAIEHIREHSSGHSETIVSDSETAITRFVREVDAAAVLANASSRFVDGGQFGFGAEIGISTQKLHARGPMGLAEMTTTKYVVLGTGQVRE